VAAAAIGNKSVTVHVLRRGVGPPRFGRARAVGRFFPSDTRPQLSTARSMTTMSETFPPVIATAWVVAIQILAVCLACFATLPRARAASGIIAPIGTLEIHTVGARCELRLCDDADEAVDEIVLPVTDDSIAGALLFVRGSSQRHAVTVEPVGQVAGFAALYRGDSLLVLQPPALGDTDRWLLQLHAPTAGAGVTTIRVHVIVEVEHRKIPDVCREASDLRRPGSCLALEASRIVVRLMPAPGPSLPRPGDADESRSPSTRTRDRSRAPHRLWVRFASRGVGGSAVL
jgi:hypothetical protein